MPTVVVTGASRGLGLEFVRQYLADGWEVVACCRQPSAALEALTASAGDALQVEAFELVQPEAMEAFAARLGTRPVDVLINNAGTMGGLTFGRDGLDPFGFGRAEAREWAEIFHLNVFVPMRLSELLVENVAASEHGRIVTLTSMLGSIGQNTLGGLYAYRASKAAVNAVMRSMAMDLAKRGIIAAPIHPGWVRTDLGGERAPLSPEDSVAGVRKVIAGLTPEQAGTFLCFDGTTMPW
jgi:NAD(P)-dependent dehydrogenase (short-subunit alcohol dehydrogenase family)